MKFELDGIVRACCLVKPFTYFDLLQSIQTLFGQQILNSLESIRCVFSRDDALRLLITNDEDLKKVIAIAEANQATKISFLLTRKKNSINSRIKSLTVQDDSGSISDDPQVLDDGNGCESPPPGTIAPLKKRTSVGVTSKTTTSKDGGSFIPESVRSSSRIMIESQISEYSRQKKSIPVEIPRSLVEDRVEVKTVPDDVYQVIILYEKADRLIPKQFVFLAILLAKRSATASTVSSGSGLSSNSNSSNTSSSSSESFSTQCSCSGHYFICKPIR